MSLFKSPQRANIRYEVTGPQKGSEGMEASQTELQSVNPVDEAEIERKREELVNHVNALFSPEDEILTIPPRDPKAKLDDLFATQDALRRRFTNLKRFITTEVKSSEERTTGLVMLDNALATLVVGLTKEMK